MPKVKGEIKTVHLPEEIKAMTVEAWLEREGLPRDTKVRVGLRLLGPYSILRSGDSVNVIVPKKG